MILYKEHNGIIKVESKEGEGSEVYYSITNNCIMKNLLCNTCLFLSFIIFSLTAYTQNNTIDSLQKLLLSEKEDTNKVNTLNELASILVNKSDFSNSLPYANKALSLAKTLSFKKGEGVAYKHLGSAAKDFDKALKYLNNALAIFKELKSQKDIGDCYFQIGVQYLYLQQNIPEAFNNVLTALKQYEKYRQKPGIANCYKLLGMMNLNLGETNEALTHSTNALKIYKEIKDSVGVAYTYNVIAGIYSQQNKNSEALQNYFSALEIYKRIGEKGPDWGIPFTQGMIGNIYLNQAETSDASGNKMEADNKFKEALALLNTKFKLEEERGLSHRETYTQLGRYYADLGYRESGTLSNKYLLESKMNYEKALEIAKQTNYKPMLLTCYSNLSYINEALGTYKEAYDNQSNFILYHDSLRNEENTKKVTQSKMQYEFDKKEAISKAEAG